MKLNRLISFGLMTAGAAATILPLQRRVIWDNANRTVAIALDYDDAVEAATRAGVSLPDLLHELWHAGATHLTVPEDTLARLMAQGRLTLTTPATPVADDPPLGRWIYLASGEPGLLDRVQAELAARQPAAGASLADDQGRTLLALSGDLASLQQIGLGFDGEIAHLAEHAGLQPLPRPVSYPWPTGATIERTLSQAAEIARSHSDGPAIVAFAGDGAPGHPGELILGHEMLMHETISALQRHGLTFAYFAESRHQRGDWFVAKSLAPDVLLAHEFTQPQLVPEDMYSAAHRWGLLARERGIRLAVLQMFKVVHATTPRDCVDYVAAVADVLVNREGMRLSGRPDFRPQHVHHSHGHGHGHDHDHGHGHHHHHHEERGAERVEGAEWRVESGEWRVEREAGSGDGETHHSDFTIQHHHHHSDDHGEGVSRAAPVFANPALLRDDDALPWIALIPAGTATLALAEFLDLPQKLALPLTLAGALAPLVVRRLDRPANELEATFRPSYAPKLVALGITATAPLAASLVSYRGGLAGVLQGELVGALAAAGLAATVADRDYTLRIEEIKTYGLDWIVPLAGALAVALAPTLTARRLTAEVEVISQVVEPVAVAPASLSPSMVRRVTSALPAAGLDRARALARTQSPRLAEAALTAGTRLVEKRLHKQLSGPTRLAAVWLLQQGTDLAKQRLVEAAQQALTPAPKEPTSVPVQVVEEPVRSVAVRRPPEPAMVTTSGEIAVRAGIAAAAIGAGLVLAKTGLLAANPLAALDQEHTAEHTHHLSRAQAAIGDARMAISPRPLRKWTFATVAALAASATMPGRAADLALVLATLGETAFLAGFREPARPLARTVADRVTLPGTRR
ncbi:MAG: DUF5693 family protein [Caldilineales bacterium]